MFEKFTPKVSSKLFYERKLRKCWTYFTNAIFDVHSRTGSRTGAAAVRTELKDACMQEVKGFYTHTCFGAVHEQKRELTLAVCTPDCPHLICKLKIEWKRTLKHNFIQFSNRKFFSCLLVLYLEFWFGLLRVKIKIKCYVVKFFADIFCYSNFKVRSGSVRSGSILRLFKLFETTNCTSIWS